MFSINIVETKKINELDHIYHTIMMKRFHIHNTTITFGTNYVCYYYSL